MNKISKVAMMLLLGASTVVAEKSLSEDELKQVADMKTSFLQPAPTTTVAAAPAAPELGGSCVVEDDKCVKSEKSKNFDVKCVANGCVGRVTSMCKAAQCQIAPIPAGSTCKKTDGEGPTKNDNFNFCKACVHQPKAEALTVCGDEAKA